MSQIEKLDFKARPAWADMTDAVLEPRSNGRFRLVIEFDVKPSTELTRCILDAVPLMQTLQTEESGAQRAGALEALMSVLRAHSKLSKSDEKRFAKVINPLPPMAVAAVSRPNPPPSKQKPKQGQSKKEPAKSNSEKAKKVDPAEEKIRARYGDGYLENPKYIEEIRKYRALKKAAKKEKE